MKFFQYDLKQVKYKILQLDLKKMFFLLSCVNA